jgi:hypothetical protein
MAPRAGRLHRASEIPYEALSSLRALPEAGAQGGEWTRYRRSDRTKHAPTGQPDPAHTRAGASGGQGSALDWTWPRAAGLPALDRALWDAQPRRATSPPRTKGRQTPPARGEPA